MFDIGWMEVVVIAVVAIVVVGPKDLPGMLRQAGRMMGQVRRTAGDFRRQFDEALKEAERQAGLEDTKKQISGLASGGPIAEIRKEIEQVSKIEAPSLNPAQAPAKSGATGPGANATLASATPDPAAPPSVPADAARRPDAA